MKNNEITVPTANNQDFETVAQIVESARNRAYQKVNEELILMYREIGKFLSTEIKTTTYGDAYVDRLADFKTN